MVRLSVWQIQSSRDAKIFTKLISTKSCPKHYKSIKYNFTIKLELHQGNSDNYNLAAQSLRLCIQTPSVPVFRDVRSLWRQFTEGMKTKHDEGFVWQAADGFCSTGPACCLSQKNTPTSILNEAAEVKLHCTEAGSQGHDSIQRDDGGQPAAEQFKGKKLLQEIHWNALTSEFWRGGWSRVSSISLERYRLDCVVSRWGCSALDYEASSRSSDQKPSYNGVLRARSQGQQGPWLCKWDLSDPTTLGVVPAQKHFGWRVKPALSKQEPREAMTVWTLCKNRSFEAVLSNILTLTNPLRV